MKEGEQKTKEKCKIPAREGRLVSSYFEPIEREGGKKTTRDGREKEVEEKGKTILWKDEREEKTGQNHTMERRKRGKT